jgi:hypothetical protein
MTFHDVPTDIPDPEVVPKAKRRSLPLPGACIYARSRRGCSAGPGGHDGYLQARMSLTIKVVASVLA